MKKIKLDKKKYKALIEEFMVVNKKKEEAKKAKEFFDFKLDDFYAHSSKAWAIVYKKIKGINPKKVYIFNHHDLVIEEIDLKKEMKK